jgi:protein farnesyltransferase/geranylgeranyltransferase type-1 subunit alpha
VQPYSVPHGTRDTDVIDLDNPLPLEGAKLPCAAAIEFLADIYEVEGGESTEKAVEVRFCLSCRSIGYFPDFA